MNASVNEMTMPLYFGITDTIPPPPADSSQIYGPSEACTGEISTYSTDVPIDCTCQWAINGIVQPGSSPALSVEWTIPGNQILTVVFINPGGQYSEPMSKLVHIDAMPEVDLGNDTVIMQGQTLILDAGNPGSTYLWSTGETTQTIAVSTTGIYWVNVSNTCGSDTDSVDVSVFIGIPEDERSSEWFTISVKDHMIVFSGVSEPVPEIQVVSISGQIIYQGIPVERISVNNRGIYFVRAVVAGNTCSRKVFVP